MNLESLIREIGELSVKNGRLNSETESTPPCFIFADRKSRASGKTKLTTKSRRRFSETVSTPHFINNTPIDNSTPMPLSPRSGLRLRVFSVPNSKSVSPLRNTIPIVIQNRSKEQMIGINAKRIVTFVKNKQVSQNVPKSDYKTDAMSRKGFGENGKLTISTRRPCGPKPAFSKIRNMRWNGAIKIHFSPKSINKLRSDMHKKTLWRASAQRALRARAQIGKSRCVSSQTENESSTIKR